MVRVVVMVTVMAMTLMSGKPLLSACYALSNHVNSLYPHHNPGRLISYYSHCTGEETEALRGYYFPRPHWYVALGFESTLH